MIQSNIKFSKIQYKQRPSYFTHRSICLGVCMLFSATFQVTKICSFYILGSVLLAACSLNPRPDHAFYGLWLMSPFNPLRLQECFRGIHIFQSLHRSMKTNKAMLISQRVVKGIFPPHEAHYWFDLNLCPVVFHWTRSTWWKVPHILTKGCGL